MKVAFNLLFIICLVAMLPACRKTGSNPSPGDSRPAKPTYQLFTVANSRLPDLQVNAIAISKNNVKWVGTADGLLRIEGDSWTVYNTQNSDLPSPVIQALAVQNNGTVWVGTDKGLARFDGSTWLVYTMANSMLPVNAIMSLAYDAHNNCTWAGTAKGIVGIDSKDKWILHDETDDVLPLSMVTDQDGTLWVGAHAHVSFRGSIKKLYNGAWTTYQLDKMGYESTFPYAIGVDRNNAIVAVLTGTAVRSVIKFNNGAWQELPRPENAFGLRALAVEQDRIWVGGQGLMQFEGPSAKRIDLPTDQNTILSMAVDQQGNKWLGTMGVGLAVYHE